MNSPASKNTRRLRISWVIIISTLISLASCGGALWRLSDPLPQGESGLEAEALAARTLERVGAHHFQAAAGAQWRFAGHRYLWHKATGRVRVSLDDELIVYLELHTGRSLALCQGERLTGEELGAAQQAALDAFNNDSFWAFAPFKLRDPGARRTLIKSPLGEALLITYETGGSTPGDSYLWLFDETGLPSSWRMWVSIIPIGGVEASWGGWIQTQSGAWVATEHHIFGLNLRVEDLQVVTQFEHLNDLDQRLTNGW